MPDGRAQHSKEISETKACWDHKPMLRTAYRNFHVEIKKRLSSVAGLDLELGSGIGTIKETIPECMTSDVFDNPFVDQTENAYALSFEDNSIANLILFDVWHHLAYPGSALQEFKRVLVPGGRVILFEPAALSVLGRLVFGCLHHEPIHETKEVDWWLPEHADSSELPYYAAQGNAWKMFRNHALPTEISSQWVLGEPLYLPALDWLAAGGFRGRQLCPSFLGGTLRLTSEIVRYCPVVFSTRMLVTLDVKKSNNR